jgi:hypothetical protein
LAGFSPYQLLYGRDPVMPGALKVLVTEPLDLDRPDRLEALVAQRAELFQRGMPMALGNLQIAQHRDTLRYAKTRSGAWKPNLVHFGVGDYLYLQREMLDTLDTQARTRILRVRAVAEGGVLELGGLDGRTVRVHMEWCAPCHRADVDLRVSTRARPYLLLILHVPGVGGRRGWLGCCYVTSVGQAGTWSACPSCSRGGLVLQPVSGGAGGSSPPQSGLRATAGEKGAAGCSRPWPCEPLAPNGCRGYL